MRYLILSLAFLILLIQYPLWFGKGGWKNVMSHRESLSVQIEGNDRQRALNVQITAEVLDLKTGLSEIEESARSDLGMIKDGEVFFKTLDNSATHSSQ